MDRITAIPLRIGDWCVDPRTGQMSHNAGESVRVEARTLMLLLYLAGRAGEVVSIDDLLSHVWSGVVVTPDSVYQAVGSLRRILGDDPKEPRYIATVPRLGYRMVARVAPWLEEPAVELTAPVAVGNRSRRARWPAVLALVAVACLAVLAALLLNGRTPANQPPKSVAVLAFLDLTTQTMSEEYFADGMTEALIDKLSKVPDLHVPPPTSSFYFKGKRATVGEIARSLGVAYLLDGSVRKSDSTLRISARLVRAADGYVVWSETYDRPEGDKLWIQEDIANEVSKALRATIH